MGEGGTENEMQGVVLKWELHLNLLSSDRDNHTQGFVLSHSALVKCQYDTVQRRLVFPPSPPAPAPPPHPPCLF